MTNVMEVPTSWKLAMILNDRLVDNEVIEKLMLNTTIDKADQILAGPKVVSHVAKMYSDMPLTKLNDLYCGFSGGNLGTSNNYARV